MVCVFTIIIPVSSYCVYIIFVAPVIEEFPEDIDVVEGESVTLQVRVTGVPTPTLTWYHNGQEVVADYSTELREDDSLFIPSSELRQAGNYRLVVRNKAGKVDQSVKVHVNKLSVTGIPVAEFGDFVSENHASDNKGFVKRFNVSIKITSELYYIGVPLF